ncbi:DUF1990 family protein [Iamia majanohamensis]|uniref:DUF1990 family protein n=1 Tax=Iamia majanohamensis TaxID=467976 RepID=A0AAF0BWJ8_9ACTN|nr:DUF1990 family protein [Iamia majanohamensis]WCO68123.1 DUF1990 family protein [Iamia majanohamensis]
MQSTLDGAAPPGTVAARFATDAVGSLAGARAALARWAPHAGIDGRVVPADPPEEGATVLVVVPFGPFEMVAPNRVVAVLDDDDRVGFAYGTLPGHPEQGEELFLAERAGPDRLRLTVRIHARGATPIVRLAGPVTRRFQALAARRYLAAWAAATSEESRR